MFLKIWVDCCMKTFFKGVFNIYCEVPGILRIVGHTRVCWSYPSMFGRTRVCWSYPGMLFIPGYIPGYVGRTRVCWSYPGLLVMLGFVGHTRACWSYPGMLVVPGYVGHTQILGSYPRRYPGKCPGASIVYNYY